jgi:ATP-dependent RNA helicase DDX19/DBP5
MSTFADTKPEAEQTPVTAAVTDSAAAPAPEAAVTSPTTNGASGASDPAVEAITKATAEISVAGASDLTEEATQPFRMRKNVTLAARQREQGHLSTGLKFDDPSMRIPQPIFEALTLDFNFVEPSGIQALTIPRIMNRRNIIAQAQTGSGKTVAFTIGMLSCIDLSQNCVQAVCLTPTRELAVQIANEAVIPMGRRMPGLRCELILKEEPGQASTYQGVCQAHIVVGTPGTVIRLMKTGYLKDLKRTVKILVCDEADEMVEEREMGVSTMQIKNALDPNVQTLLFSATFPPEVVAYCHRIVKMAAVITIETNNEMVLDTIFQVRLDVRGAPPDTVDGKKLYALKELYLHLTIDQSMIFADTKKQVEDIAQLLVLDNYTVSYMHGGLSGPERDEEIRKFKNGETKVLIATNVLSKGLDVPAVDLVINYSLPLKHPSKKPDAITYLHRIGRCGRFGRPGTSVVLMAEPADAEKLMTVERFYNFNETKRMTHPWDVRQIAALGDKARDISDNASFVPVQLENKIVVNDAAYEGSGKAK